MDNAIYSRLSTLFMLQTNQKVESDPELELDLKVQCRSAKEALSLRGKVCLSCTLT